MKDMTLPMIHCYACQTALDTVETGVYAICPKCHSANYVSTQSAEEDNKQYFNNHKPSSNNRLRAYLFSIFNHVDQLIHVKDYSAYKSILQTIEKKINSSQKTVEIGFGGGDELINRLKRGANCYGIDLSHNVVESFKKNYPEYSERVVCGPAGKSSIACDLIYSNALFEHLDQPNEFLKAAHDQLQENGILVLRIPLKIDANASNDATDINYWKPCHQALYSPQGIEIILQRNGFKILEQATLPYFGYKVMNQLLQDGYESIHDIRCPYAEIPNLSIFHFVKALIQGLFKKLICVEYAAISIKV